MDKNNSRFLRACASSLLHDLSTARKCIGFHVASPFNPFSIRFRTDLDCLYSALKLLYNDVDDYLSNHPYDDCSF